MMMIKFTWVVIIWLSCFLRHIDGVAIQIPILEHHITSLFFQVFIEVVYGSHNQVCTVQVLLDLNLNSNTL